MGFEVLGFGRESSVRSAESSGFGGVITFDVFFFLRRGEFQRTCSGGSGLLFSGFGSRVWVFRGFMVKRLRSVGVMGLADSGAGGLPELKGDPLDPKS